MAVTRTRLRPSFSFRCLGAGFFCVSTGCSGGSHSGPPASPVVLGAKTISTGNVFRGTFTPDGDTLYYFKNVTEGEEDYRIFRAHRTPDGWSTPERVTPGGDHSDLYPAITPDGHRMVFSSYRPAPGDTSAHPSAYLWYVQRDGAAWGTPVFMAEATELSHYHSQPIFDARGDLYFSRSGWDYRGHSEHVSRWDGMEYRRPDTSAVWLAWRDRIGSGLHLYETTPGYDGSFALLVIGERPDSGRPGAPDLHVTFRSDTGWTAPRPLRGGVNTPLAENFAFYSPGGRELHFVRDFAAFYRLPLEQALGPRPPTVPASASGGAIATGLEPGMQLLYESEGETQPPWSIDSVLLRAPLRGRSECAVVHLRRLPDQAAPEEIRLCLANDTLYRWDGQRGAWSILRPVGPGMTWTSRPSGGDIVRYETGEAGQESISGRTIPVIHTTVTTTDSTGRPKRRLRERYALSLTTATGGAFEVADSTRAGEWLVQRRFELRDIRPAP